MAKLTDEQQGAFIDLVQKVEEEDRSKRQVQVKEALKHELYWKGEQHIFWDESQMDWRIPTHDVIRSLLPEEEVNFVYQHTVNIFKAHGESIIAALASEVPHVQFGPRNMEDPEDDLAVKVADSTARMVADQNKVHLLIIHALYLLALEGMCASYCYHKKSEDFGTLEIPQYGKEKRKSVTFFCENCGIVRDSNEPCPECGGALTPIEGEEEEVPVQGEPKLVPKGREIIEIYGVRDVKVLASAKEPKEIGYLILYKDVHPAQIKEVFGADVKRHGADWERQMRLIDEDSPLVTVKYCWFLPWMLNSAMESERGELREKYPKGCRVVICQGDVLDEREEDLHDHWKIAKAGPSRGIHADALLKPLASPQDIRNNLENFLLMQVEYGVPSSYASTAIVDFEGQPYREQLPGYTYPVGPIPPGRRLDDFFYTEKSTTVPHEAAELKRLVDTDAQFVVGSFPSVYGGAAVGGSKTLGEYEKSRAYALQRLALPWYFLTVWWGETIHLSVKSFKDHQLEDEFWTSRIGGEMKTVWIRKADFKGSFVRIEPEVSTSIPVSFTQKRGVIMELAGLNSPEINEVLYSPENARVVSSYVGLKELKIPGELQRSRQMREITALLRGEPQEGDEGVLIPSVMVNDDIDDHEIHFEVIRNFLAGDSGQELVDSRPNAFVNCIAHLRMHRMFLAQEVSAEGEENEKSAPSGEEEKKE